MKTEPETYSFKQLIKDGSTNWNGVRNFQARNFLREAKPGDFALIYHSGSERAVVGISKVVAAAYSDPDSEHPGDWVQIDLEPIQELKQPVSLGELKKDKRFSDMYLLRQSRLSVMPLSKKHYEEILKLSETLQTKVGAKSK